MRRRAAWLSRGFEELVARLDPRRPAGEPDFDVVIVGSGYGGAIAAAELAGCKEGEGAEARKISVCVLERGKEYLPGMFPARLAELPGHVRFSSDGAKGPRGKLEGLFDFRLGADVSALVGNGLGGGSLINAGVMEVPAPGAFDRWPAALRQDLVQGDYFDRARKMLGAADEHGRSNDVSGHPDHGEIRKRAALRRLAGPGGGFRDAAVTIAMQDKLNSARVERKACKLCGDCATGCNFEAKDSLDANLLVKAHRRGARIYCGATVLRLGRHPRSGLWNLQVAYTDATLRKRHGAPIEVRARRVILAAGTFGSTEILLRSRSEALDFSPRLGQRFSGNGDAIAAVYDADDEVRCAADERVPPAERKVGPTITGVVDRRGDRGLLIQELAIPAAMRRMFEEVVATSHALRQLGEPDPDDHGSDAARDPLALDRGKLARTAVLAVIGPDRGDGSIELDPDASGDGGVRVRWPQYRTDAVFDGQYALLRDLVPNAGAGARVLPNPLWQLLPPDLEFVFAGMKGPGFTVHPLGGCPIGSTLGEGAVNELGEVFRESARNDSTDPWPGLVVLDGAIVPSPLGTNPALTIAALALRAVEKLRANWRLQPPAARRQRAVRRPEYAPPPQTVASPAATKIEILERLAGPVELNSRASEIYLGPKACKPYVVHLTLKFEPFAAAELFDPPGERPMRRSLQVAAGSAMRLFDARTYAKFQREGARPEEYNDIALVEAPLSGRLDLLHRERCGAEQRRSRAFNAFLLNRGLRDGWQWFWNGVRKGFPDGFRAELRARWKAGQVLATRSGEVRLLEYELKTGPAADVRTREGAPADAAGFAERDIRGRKRLTYACRSNPWRQLMQISLEEFPLLAPGKRPVLQLDTKYLAQQGVPLLRIVGQEDQPSAIADLGSLAAYFLRLVVTVHAWSFRSPDAPAPREPQRLPGVLPLLKHPEIKLLELDRLDDGTPVNVRLTRYRPRGAKRTPVVLIHGYSASGTTFAHPALDCGLAEHLYWKRRDVWVLDLRTSSGMPTARHPWAFEDAALADIPVAVDHICRHTGAPQVDVFAHCMGSAMFSMAILAAPEPGERFFREREEMHRRIRRAVLSQIGPHVMLSPENIFRGYVMSYVRHMLPLAQYDFRVPDDPGLLDNILDRLLATLPYPEWEYRAENPLWPWARAPFVGTRHRMDALYGRDFSLATRRGCRLLSRPVLDHIDDFFGPLSIETVAQAIHFAREQRITDSKGTAFPRRERFQARWQFPTLSVHGEDNGLSDIGTLGLMAKNVRDDGKVPWSCESFEGFGHQDSLIGKRAGKVFRRISEFLGEGQP